jgi:hypothetical protein
MAEKEKVKLVSLGFWKAVLFMSLLFLFIGFIFGIGFIFFLEAALESFEITNVPIFGRLVLSLVLIPFGFCFIFTFFGIIFLLIINLILKVIKGIPLYFQEESFTETKSIIIEEPYVLPSYDPNS